MHKQTYLIDMCFARVFLRHCGVSPVEQVGISHDVSEYWHFNVRVDGGETARFDHEYSAVGVFCEPTCKHRSRRSAANCDV